MKCSTFFFKKIFSFIIIYNDTCIFQNIESTLMDFIQSFRTDDL